MCGFVTIISKNNKPISKEIVKRMTDDIIHRGPDDSGYWLSDWCGIGFRRLSVIDLSEHGHQPMFDPSRTYVIAYNGELYNYSILRKKLQGEGVIFFSTSDTEVVLQAFIHWGEACLEKFEGMFALIIVKIPTKEVFVARDHLGIKPLYYSENNDFIFFSSEIKSLRHVMAFELNHDVLYEQLVYRYVAGPETPFKNIYKCLPGSYLKITKGNSPQLNSYYDLTCSLDYRENIGEEKLLHILENSLKESINLHTASDVGFNVQLSGGVDSSFITAILSKDLEQNLNTFSITLDDIDCDESKYQKMVSSSYSTKHHEIHVNDKLFVESLERATWHMDVPIVHLGCVFLMVLCHHSKEDSKVILTGEGADELFGGYSRYCLDKKTRIVSALKWLGIRGNWLPHLSSFEGIKKRLSAKVIERQLYFQKENITGYFYDLRENTHYRDYVVESHGSYLSQMLAHDQKCYLPSLLDRQDKMSMAASVEARVPVCNHRLFDMVNPIPESLKLKENITKYLLKKIAETYLDKSLLYRRKNGLNLPLDKWLRKGPLSERLSLLTDQTARQREFYNHSRIAVAIDDHVQGKTNNSKYLMPILTFEIWMRMFIDNGCSSHN